MTDQWDEEERMDLGIAGRKAIVCASSRGLGRACAMELARAGLTAFLAGVARSVAASNVTINFVLPGTFDTDRLRSNMAANAKRKGVSIEDARAERIATVPAKRFGEPEEFGQACAFLCSAHAGYITGQNLLIDGGVFPGTLG